MAGRFQWIVGTGSWGCDVHLYKDGSFSAEYFEKNVDLEDEDVPWGFYISSYTGVLAPPVQIDARTWSTTPQAIQMEREPGEVYIENGVHYITTDPIGLGDAKTILIYTPGILADELPEELLNWSDLDPFAFDSDQRLQVYIIYNADDNLSFSTVQQADNPGWPVQW